MLSTLCGLATLGIVLAYILVPPPPQYHRTSYMEFALLNNWLCNLEGSETVCSPGEAPPHDSIIIFAAKKRGHSDTLADYKKHLGNNAQLLHRMDLPAPRRYAI